MLKFSIYWVNFMWLEPKWLQKNKKYKGNCYKQDFPIFDMPQIYKSLILKTEYQTAALLPIITPPLFLACSQLYY